MVPILNQHLFTQECLRGLTVLGPLMFLLYVNDITKRIESPLTLFADGCILYRTIKTHEDATKLQQDLDLLHEWAVKWQLRFNVLLCAKQELYHQL